MQHKQVNLKIESNQKSDRLFIRFRQQGNVKMHSHDCFELAYIIKGSAMQTLNGKSEFVRKGAYYFIDLGSEHNYTDSSELELVNCLFSPELIDASLSKCSSFKELMQICMIRYYSQCLDLTPVNRIFYDEDGKILQILQEMRAEYQDQNFGYQEIFRAKLLEILILTMRKVIEQYGSVPIEKIMNNPIIQDAVYYFQSNYREKALLESFCQKHHYNAQYISRLFKKETGMTVLTYVQKYRIEKSCHLLTESGLPIGEVAHQSGYEDMKYFNQTFRKITGMTPGEYRKARLNAR